VIFRKREDSCLHDRRLEIIIAGTIACDSPVSHAIVYFGVTRTWADVDSRSWCAKEKGSRVCGRAVSKWKCKTVQRVMHLTSRGVINYRWAVRMCSSIVEYNDSYFVWSRRSYEVRLNRPYMSCSGGMLTSWIPPCDSSTSRVIYSHCKLLDLFASSYKYLINNMTICARTTKIMIILSIFKFIKLNLFLNQLWLNYLSELKLLKFSKYLNIRLNI